jgi:heme oxygenase
MVSPHSSPAGEAAAREIAALAACSPLAPLGMLYVLEGSTNGNRFIVRAVRGGLRLTPGTGDSYLNCYGEEQPVRWQSFKQGLESATFTEAEYQQLADGAVLIFQAVGHLSDELANPSGQKVMTTPIYTDGRKGAWHG